MVETFSGTAFFLRGPQLRSLRRPQVDFGAPLFLFLLLLLLYSVVEQQQNAAAARREVGQTTRSNN